MAERAAAARHVVLVGLSGAGKSTVGPLVAAALGRPFVDLDARIEREAGCTVAELFAQEGEAAFRARELAVTRALCDAPPTVVAVGGGWVTAPGAMATLAPRALTVYLRVSPGVAAQRLGEGGAGRPLLQGGGMHPRLAAQLAGREALYLQSNHVVDVDWMTPADVADAIVALASGAAGD